MGFLDQLALRGPGIAARGLAGQRAGEDRRRQQQREDEQRQREIQQSALQQMLLQMNLEEGRLDRPVARAEREARAADYRAQAEGTGRYAPKEPTPRNIDPNDPAVIAARNTQAEKMARLTASLRPASGSSGGQNPKNAPAGVIKTVIGNNSQISVIDNALGIMDRMVKTKGKVSGLGISNFALGDNIKDVVGISSDDEQNLRAAVADIGSLEIRDRSGAAVTASEFPRLKPFIPRHTDPPQKTLNNLKRMREIILEETELYEANYSPEQGYNPIQRGGGAIPKASPKDADDLAQERAELEAYRKRRAARKP